MITRRTEQTMIITRRTEQTMIITLIGPNKQ